MTDGLPRTTCKVRGPCIRTTTAPQRQKTLLSGGMVLLSGALCFVLVTVGCAYKIGIFVPDTAGSHVLYHSRVADVLAKAGHDVTLIRIDSINAPRKDYITVKSIKQWRISAVKSNESYDDILSMHSANAFKDVSPLSAEQRKTFGKFLGSFAGACEELLKNTDFLRQLKDEKFDIAFAHTYDFCPIGLIHYAQIPTWIWLSNTELFDHQGTYMGLSSPSSYVPPAFFGSGEELTFFERVKSFVGWIVMIPLVERFFIRPETDLFRKYFGEDFPDLIDLAKQCPLVMINSNELYSIPRPTLAKIVSIGGIGIKETSAKALEGEFKEIAEKADQIVLMTFGSFTNASNMPDSWKDAFMSAFKKFENTHFIIRYETNDLKEQGKLPKNVHLAKWIPQNDLLQHPKTVALISHGGHNSLQEAIHAGIPLIGIPLYGNQQATIRTAERNKLGFLLPKNEISEERIVHALNTVINNKEYKESSRRLSAMLKSKPVSSEQLLVRWTEFVAEFRTLPNLVPYSTKLGFIAFYCIDVVAFLIAATSLTLFIVFHCARTTIRCVYRRLWLERKKKGDEARSKKTR